jgi:hypothetical protein
MLNELHLLLDIWTPMISWALGVGVVFAVFAGFVRIGYRYAGWILLLAILVYLLG